MSPIIITLVLAGVFFQGQEDQEVALGIASFEKGDFKNAQRYLSNSVHRARDVAQASWYYSLANIAISNDVKLKEKEALLVTASGLLENLASSSSIYAVGAAIGFNDCVLQTSRIRSSDYLLKANELLKNALKKAPISDLDLMRINKRIAYNTFLIAQGDAPKDESSQNKAGGGDKKQGDKVRNRNPQRIKIRVVFLIRSLITQKGKRRRRKLRA